jgi:hypothetical protein
MCSVCYLFAAYVVVCYLLSLSILTCSWAVVVFFFLVVWLGVGFLNGLLGCE